MNKIISSHSRNNHQTISTEHRDVKKLLGMIVNLSVKKVFFISLLVFFCVFSSNLFSQGWYNSSWLYRKVITIDYTKVGSTGAPHVNFPVLVSLTSDAHLSSNARSDGYDILFTSSDGTTKLYHDRESYSSGTLVAWVKILSLSASANTVIYMYYGNAVASDQQDKNNTLNSNYKGVWHLDEASGTFYDATSNHNDGTDYVSATGKTGIIGSGQEFDGADDYVDVGNDASLSMTSGITIEAWIYWHGESSATDDLQNVVTNGAWNRALRVTEPDHWVGGGSHVLSMFTIGGANKFLYSSSQLSTNTWTHIATTYDGSALKIYINGEEDTSNAASGSIVSAADNTYIGTEETSVYMFDGIIDEVRVSSTARSSGWILTEYNNQNSSSTFYSIEQGPLPVELTCFYSEINKRNVILRWRTAWEINNSGFEVQRRTVQNEGQNSDWVKIAFVRGYGTTNSEKDYILEDKNLITGKYKYRLIQIDYNNAATIYDLSSTINIGIPKKSELSQNYPNPFNPITKIDYNITYNSKVTLKVFDITGREISTLVNETQEAGYYTVQFNASEFASGTYFYRLTTESGQDNFVMTKRMILVK